MTSAAWDATVLATCAKASPLCTEVTIDEAALEAVADWMCFEVFPSIGGDQADPERPNLGDRETQIDFVGVTTAINFAYTDFETHIPWSIEHEGHELVDADAMFLRFEEALAAGIPVTDGTWLATLTEEKLLEVLHGPRQIPMIAERVAVLRGLGDVLVAKYGGRFATFVDDCPPLAYDNGNGLLERLIAEFPCFDDSARVHGVDVRIDKLAQLGVWSLHRLGYVQLQDLDKVSVFADYIVPAALRAMKVFLYSDELAHAVDSRAIVTAGSQHEVEIRVQTIVACARLTDALNARRSPDRQLVNAQVDYRFWSAFHDLIQPHHLTITTRY